MGLLLSEKSHKISEKAIAIAKELKCSYLGCEHMFLALLKEESAFIKLLDVFSVDKDNLEEEIIENVISNEIVVKSALPETPRLKKVLQIAQKEAELAKVFKIEPIFIFTATLKEENSLPARLLKQKGVNLSELIEKAYKVQSKPEELDKISASSKSKSAPFIEKFGRDLTQLAKEGKTDPVIGRKDEIKRIMQILSRKTKNNPVLIGEAGTGKTAIVLGLANKIAEGQVHANLKNKRLIELSLAALVAGAKYRGDFEERMQKIIKEVESNPDIILFIDEIHTLIGAGGSGGIEASNILKPALAKGEFPCIGATTTDEYRKYIESDPALERRFQPVLVKEPSEEETLEILEGLKPNFEKHHGVTFTPDSLKQAVKLSVRFLTDRHLPDKAIDLIDEAAAKVKLKTIQPEESKFQVTAEDIAQVVTSQTGIPVARLTEDEAVRILKTEEILSEKIIGQPQAVKSVSETIKVSRAGLANFKKPTGVFMFLGPTGVGKTYLAKLLAEFLFGSSEAMIRLDMSEYMEKHSVARLVGAPPGYIGYGEEGHLTKTVRTKPYSVVLLDEIEKAHPEVFDIFLQIFDEGRLTDAKGRVINFCNTIIIMTSNLGTTSTDSQGNLIIQDTSLKETQDQIMQKVRKTFRPEFLNRIDDIIFFNSLSAENLKKIVQLNLKDLDKSLSEKGLRFDITKEVVDLLVKEGTNLSYGARPLARTIQTLLARPLAECILKGEFKSGDIIQINLENGKISFRKI